MSGIQDDIDKSGITIEEFLELGGQVPGGLGVQDNPEIPDSEDLTKGCLSN